MEFLGIGPAEFLFIIVIIIVVVGQRDIQKTARSLGRGLNAMYKSEGWKAFTEVSQQLRALPNRLAREAELEEIQRTAQEVKETVTAANPMAAWTPDGKKTGAPMSPSISTVEQGSGDAASTTAAAPADPADASVSTPPTPNS
ncbi:MAG: hypothetical protein HY260_11780 [Chloroflexi bacterium]|nr:hypothetical protein [Chloroflexota bacterium]